MSSLLAHFCVFHRLPALYVVRCENYPALLSLPFLSLYTYMYM